MKRSAAWIQILSYVVALESERNLKLYFNLPRDQREYFFKDKLKITFWLKARERLRC